MKTERNTAGNTGSAKVAVQCSAKTFVVNQTLVLRINFCSKNRHLRLAQIVSYDFNDDLTNKY